eukprot:6193005-Pleurochrysis_carterae.AAC.1
MMYSIESLSYATACRSCVAKVVHCYRPTKAQGHAQQLKMVIEYPWISLILASLALIIRELGHKRCCSVQCASLGNEFLERPVLDEQPKVLLWFLQQSVVRSTRDLDGSASRERLPRPHARRCHEVRLGRHEQCVQRPALPVELGGAAPDCARVRIGIGKECWRRDDATCVRQAEGVCVTSASVEESRGLSLDQRHGRRRVREREAQRKRQLLR